MTRIAFLGLGAMGSRMARRLLAASHDVAVWNRTPGVDEELVALGAKRAGSPRDAAAQADVVIAMVRDDDASRAVWLDAAHGALPAMRAGSVAIECSTVSVAWIRELEAAARSRRVALMEAPVVGSRPQADAGQLIVFAGGDPACIEAQRPLLETWATAIHLVGPVGCAAAAKLIVNVLYGTQVAVLAELTSFARAQGVDPACVVDAVTSTPACGPGAAVALRAMLDGKWQPMFPLHLVAKDFGLVADVRRVAASPLPITSAAMSVFRGAIAAGFGEDNITGVIQRYA